mgnify:CR=1 FL=1
MSHHGGHWLSSARMLPGLDLMNVGSVNLQTRQLVIPRICASHEGDLEVANTMIWEAAEPPSLPRSRS